MGVEIANSGKPIQFYTFDHWDGSAGDADAAEAAVMNSLAEPGENGRTIIVIAHRLSSISRADIVVRLKGGEVAETGSFAGLIGGSTQVRAAGKPRTARTPGR